MGDIRRWGGWAALGAVVAGIITFALLSRQLPLFRSQSAVLIQFSDNENVNWSHAAAIYVQLARGQAAIQSALDSTHTALTADALAGMVDTMLEPDSQLLVIVVTTADPAQAQALADALAQQVITAGQKLSANPDADKLHTQINDLYTQIDAAHSEWQTLDAQIAATHDPPTLADLRARRTDVLDRYLLLESNLAALNAQYMQLTRGIPTLTVASAAGATIPVTAVSPIIGALILAFLGGIGALILRVWIDNADIALRTPIAIKRAFDLPTLAVIPPIRVKPGEEKLISHADAAYAEPYRVLAVGLGLSESAPGWTVGITSSAADEGKSLTAANLGIALAESGRRTLIIDADLRTPMQHRLFKVSNRDGLTGLLHEFSLRADAQGDEDALTDLRSGIRRADVANLSLLTSGPLPPYPDEVLGSAYLPRLLRVVAGQYDVILIDMPPTQAANAIRGIAACLDSALLVIDAQRTRRRAARKAVQLLQQVDARLSGAALNRARLRESDANSAQKL